MPNGLETEKDPESVALISRIGTDGGDVLIKYAWRLWRLVAVDKDMET